jgi:hypothetical protein
MREHRVDALGRSGDRPVDPFLRQQQRAAHALRLAQGQQRALQHGRIGETGEVIQRGNGDGHG